MAPLWVFDDGILSGFDDVDDLIVPFVDRHLGRPPRHPSALKRESSDGSLPPIYPRRQPHQQQQRHGVSLLPPPPPSSILRTHGRRLSTSLGPQNKRRKVSIQDSYRVRDVESRHDYSSQERKACWYDKAELRSMKEEANDDAQLMERGLLSDDEHICLRGLECRTQLGARRRKDNRSNAYAAVFFELDSQQLQQQHEQKQQDADDGDRAVADAYSSYSESCQFAAYMRGLRDAAAVQRQELNPSPAPPSISAPKPQQQQQRQRQQQPQHHLFFQQGMMSLSCYGLMDLSSSPSSSSAASTSSSSSLPNVSLPSSYWEALISSAA